MAPSAISTLPESTSYHVLITGGTGFVATHIVDQLLKLGHTITATTRDAKKAQSLYTTFPHYEGKVVFVSVPDFTSAGAFDHVFESPNFDFVLHTASPLPHNAADVKRDIIEPGIQGIANLFTTAHKLGGTRLKRIILTSSGVTQFNPFAPDSAEPVTVTEEDWNPITADVAAESGNPGLAYFASKTLAERAAWDFVATEKPSFDLTALLPVIVLGPVLTPVTSAKSIEQGADSHIYKYVDGRVKNVGDAPYIFYAHVDVRDVARAHVVSMTLPAAGGERITLVSDSTFSPQTTVDVIAKHFPQLGDRIARGEPEQVYPKDAKLWFLSGEKAKRIFGPDVVARTAEDSVVDVVQQVLEQEKEWL